MIYGDGVFILKTKHPLSGEEYRVSYVDDISVIYKKFNDTTKRWDTDAAQLWKSFRLADTYNDIIPAMIHAKEHMRRVGTETDCGIMVINLVSKTWDDLINDVDIPMK